MNFNPKCCRNEAEIRSKLVVHYLIPKLGYFPDNWYEEVSYNNIRLDFLVFNKASSLNQGKNNLSFSLIIETKHPRENLNNHVNTVRQYLNTFRAGYGILTNAREFRIYQRSQSQIQADGLFPNSLKLLFQCSGEEIDANIEAIKNLISKQSIELIQIINNKLPGKIPPLQTFNEESLVELVRKLKPILRSDRKANDFAKQIEKHRPFESLISIVEKVTGLGDKTMLKIIDSWLYS